MEALLKVGCRDVESKLSGINLKHTVGPAVSEKIWVLNVEF